MKVSVQVKFSKISKAVFDNNVYLVYTNQKPIEGKANEDIIYQLGKYFDISKSNIKLITGQKSKTKIFEIKKLSNS